MNYATFRIFVLAVIRAIDIYLLYQVIAVNRGSERTPGKKASSEFSKLKLKNCKKPASLLKMSFIYFSRIVTAKARTPIS